MNPTPPAAAPRADYRQLRAAAIARIQARSAELAALPDLYLIVIERALDRDLRGIQAFTRNAGHLFAPDRSDSVAALTEAHRP